MQTEQFQLHAEIEQRHWWFVGRRRILRRLLAEVLPASRDTLLVDVGCGTGGNIASLSADYACAGIDTSAEAIAIARQQFPGVRFFAGKAPEGLGELAGQARGVMLMDVLEHVEDDEGLLADLVAALSPGCWLLVTVPADPSLWSAHDVAFGHYRRYDRQGLEKLWEALPVGPKLVSHFNARLLPVIRAIRTWNRRRGRASGTAGTDFWLPSRPVNRLLGATFAGEGPRLVDALHGRRKGYSRGASLVALLRREG